VPPSCSECASKTQSAAGGAPTQSASRLWRSSEGKTRIDTPQSSVISDPVAKQTIVLDHLKKEASIIPMPPPGSPIALPGAPPGAAGAVKPPEMQVEHLGKSMIDGHEVEGKRFTLPHTPAPPKPAMPTPPAKPAMPKLAIPKLAMPKLAIPKLAIPGGKPPEAPAMPKPPAAPKLPAKPSVTELWTSVKLKTPVLTKVSTAAGEQTTYCKPTETAEHPPSVFQIPPGYKIKPKL
jgi:hypothetical protein